MLEVLQVALGEVGYLEKKNARQMDDKTANAGSGNYTKYARDLFPGLQGQPWCDMFVDWCMWRAYGRERALKLLCGSFAAYTVTSAGLYKRAGRWGTEPKVGSPIFFRNASRICHTGLVYKVAGGKVYTIEGNTSGASGVVANGGGVCKKVYAVGYDRIAGYGYPDYEGVLAGSLWASTCPFAEPSWYIRRGQTGEGVRWIQWMLNRHGATLDVDGEFGPVTAAAVQCFQSIRGLEADGIVGPETRQALKA